VLGTFIVGIGPSDVAFDGINIGVTNFDIGFGNTVTMTNYGSSNVTKLRASDGQVLGTFAVGLEPGGVAFDGANIWVANLFSNFVSKL